MAATDAILGQMSDSEHQACLRRAVVASTVGTTIEWYDFLIYSTVTGLVFGKVYFPGNDPLVSTLQAFGVFFVGSQFRVGIATADMRLSHALIERYCRLRRDRFFRVRRNGHRDRGGRYIDSRLRFRRRGDAAIRERFECMRRHVVDRDVLRLVDAHAATHVEQAARCVEHFFAVATTHESAAQRELLRLEPENGFAEGTACR